jgi:hypothetical protein
MDAGLVESTPGGCAGMRKRTSPFLIYSAIIVAGLVMQVAWYGLLWSRMITQPEISRPTDFSIFYTAGRIAAEGHIGQVFNIQTQLEVQEKLLGYKFPLSNLLPFNHPPLLVPILQLISTQDYMASYWRWVLIMFGLIVATLLVLNRLLRAVQWEEGSRSIFILCCLLFYPIFVGLLKGQDTAFLLLGALVWFYGMVTKKDAVAGLGLALTVIRPQIALVLAVPFLFARRRVWWWFFGGAALLGIYCLALIGVGGVRDFLSLLRISALGQGFGMDQNAMFNFTGMALRLFTSANTNGVHLAAWALLLAAIIGLSVWWKVSSEIQFRQIVLAVALSVFVAPHLHYHDLILLLIPVIGTMIVLVRGGRLKTQGAAAMTVLISVVWMVGEAWDPARLTFPYLLMAGLPALTWFHETH